MGSPARSSGRGRTSHAHHTRPRSHTARNARPRTRRLRCRPRAGSPRARLRIQCRDPRESRTRHGHRASRGDRRRTSMAHQVAVQDDRRALPEVHESTALRATTSAHADELQPACNGAAASPAPSVAKMWRSAPAYREELDEDGAPRVQRAQDLSDAGSREDARDVESGGVNESILGRLASPASDPSAAVPDVRADQVHGRRPAAQQPTTAAVEVRPSAFHGAPCPSADVSSSGLI